MYHIKVLGGPFFIEEEKSDSEKGREKGEPTHTKGYQAAQFQETELTGFAVQKQPPLKPSMSTGSLERLPLCSGI